MSTKKGLFGSLFGSKKNNGCCNMEIVEESSCDCGCSCTPKEEEKVSCDCGGACNIEKTADILILGPGCKNCQTLETNTRKALEILGDNSTIGHVTDFSEIAQYGVMSTPGLVIDGKVVSQGKVLKPEDIVTIIKKAND